MTLAEAMRSDLRWRTENKGPVQLMDKHLKGISLLDGSIAIIGGGSPCTRYSPAVRYLHDEIAVGLHARPTNLVFDVASAIQGFQQRYPAGTAFLHELTKPYHTSMGEELSNLLGDAVEIDAANYIGHGNGARMGATRFFHEKETSVPPQS